MIINTSDSLERENYIVKNVIGLLKNNVPSDEILILALNGFKKEKLINKIEEEFFKSTNRGIQALNIYTFQGLVRNSLLKNWPVVENFLIKNFDNPEIIPDLTGLDSSQYILKNIIKQADFQDYFSKKNLMHQLLRRYKLIVENSLSQEELSQRSNILNESFSESAAQALKTYKYLSSKYRQFDNIKQVSTFMYLFKQGLIHDFDNIKYFFVDDLDEMNYVSFEFCEKMFKQAESFVSLDEYGSTRRGYLCAYPNSFKRIKSEFQFEKLPSTISANLSEDAAGLFDNIRNNSKNELKNFELNNYSKRLEMIEAVCEKIIELVKQGVKQNDIILVAPDIDKNLYFSINSILRKSNIKLQSLKGNKKILEDNYVSSILTILALINREKNILINSFDIRILLNIIFKIPLYECKYIIEYFDKNKSLPDIELEKYPAYKNLINIINDEEFREQSLFEQFTQIFKKITAPALENDYDFDCLNLFGKSINEFENLQKKFLADGINLTLEDWYYHLKTSVVSQTPSNPAHIDKSSILISTIQKVVDFSLYSKYQIWLDASSPDWIKEDTGTIYNSWVMQKDYNLQEFSAENNKKFTIEKTASLIRKLTLLAEDKIYCYSSTYNSSGTQNTGELADFIKIIKNEKKEFAFTPRDDQKPILDYKSGYMAVPAVPGAGKTTVMLALLFALVKKGINPKKIVVLTYMESAANNFLNRYKDISGDVQNLPSISTIHSFAYRLLNENDNYTRVNLENGFSVCDDIIRSKILEELAVKFLPDNIDFKSEVELIQKAVSRVKTRQIEIKSKEINDNTLKNFAETYDLYNKKLKELNLIDYDDLLVLAIKLLKENKDILEYYQEKFEYIIEDEAQDSSAIQQELIGILTDKSQNLIRCGDVNQAITGTFSEADVEGFKQFINNNPSFSMTTSQRCTKKIYELANALIDYSLTSDVMKNSFFNLKMQGIEGKNPISEKPIIFKTYENQNAQMQDIIVDIKQILQSCKNGNKPTFAILLRSNRAVFEWAAFLEKNGLDVICMTESLNQKKLFKFMLILLKFFVEPFSNKNAADMYKEFCNIGKYSFDKTIYEKIKESKELFISPSFLKNEAKNNKAIELIWWDIEAIIEDNTISLQELIIKAANNYFDDITDKSNAYIFSLLIDKYLNISDNEEKIELNKSKNVIKYFTELLSKNSIKGVNIFAKDKSAEELQGYVQIMTIHKAKGAEYDYVYLPEFSSKNFNIDFVSLCKKHETKSGSLLKKIDILSKKKVNPSFIAREEIEETLRLIYVAITRAEKSLFIAFPEKIGFKKQEKSKLWEVIENFATQNTV